MLGKSKQIVIISILRRTVQTLKNALIIGTNSAAAGTWKYVPDGLVAQAEPYDMSKTLCVDDGSWAITMSMVHDST